METKDKVIISKKVMIFIQTLAIAFFMHGTHIGAKLADRL